MNQHTAFLHSDLTSEINAAAISVHRELGPGFLEPISEEAICVEFERRRLAYQLAVALAYLKATGLDVGLIITLRTL